MMSPMLAAPVTAQDHVEGRADAAMTLVQYGDFECPYTRMSLHSVHQLQREYPDTLRFVFRHFPLEEIHPHARAAATAAEAAEAQDRTSPEVTNRIDRDLASGGDSGVEGTPTFYVNGVRHNGMYEVDSLRSAIQSQLMAAGKRAGG